ncbi:hypothetical protein BRD13_04285 [Halobacteriales archaeon SW_5_70_135]|nr:MAG: hypothetical protein BRD13_04285 [Halobacteriales archaeon SW_5_70_135]
MTGAGTGAARHDLWGESLPLNPAGDDIPRDGSPRDRATGRSRARVETRPADLGRASPETDRQPAGFPLCGGSRAVYGTEDVTSAVRPSQGAGTRSVRGA